MIRPTSDHSRLALKTALKRLIVQVGGYDAAEACSRVAKSRLHRYGDATQDEHHAPIDVVADLEKIAGAPLITAELAALAGYTLMPIELGKGDLAADLQDVGRDAGETMADALRALSGQMDLKNMECVRADLARLLRDGARALGELTHRIERGNEGTGA